MKLTRNITLITLIAVLLTACAPKATPTTQPTAEAAVDLEARALAMVENLNKGDYAAASAEFDDKMLAALPGNKLQETWEGLLAQTGAFQNITGTYSEEAGGYKLIFVTCVFEKAAIDVRVAFNSEGKISGMFFQPAKAGSSTPVSYNPPSYVQQNSFQETDVTVGSGEWALPGTLSMPNGAGPFPAVVLVHGSGPNDRDETIGPNKGFKDIAWGLASRGIAVLRYDKRTLVYGAKYDQAMLAKITVQDEVIDDALSALNLLRSQAKIDPKRVFLLGHSLGATVAPRIATQDSAIAGLIMMAGISRPMEDVVLEQYEYLYNLDGELSESDKAEINVLKTQVAQVKDPGLSVDTPANTLPLSMPAAYWLDLRGYNPAETAKTLSIPILILQGERDYQVTMSNFKIFQDTLNGMSNVTLKSYPALNHLFIAGEGQPNPQEYNNPGHVAEEVVKDIADWILK